MKLCHRNIRNIMEQGKMGKKEIWNYSKFLYQLMTNMNIENQQKYFTLRNNSTEQLKELLRNNRSDLKSFREDLTKYFCDVPPLRAVSHACTLRQGWKPRKSTTKMRF